MSETLTQGADMEYAQVSDAELTEMRDAAFSAYEVSSQAVTDTLDAMADLPYPSEQYAVLHAQMPVLRAAMLADSGRFAAVCAEMTRRYDAATGTPDHVDMVCTRCRKAVEKVPGTTGWVHQFVDYMTPCVPSADIKAMVAAGNENVPAAR